jgi:hypothetical protein
VAIRAAIVNHRTVDSDIDMLIDATLACGRRRSPAAAISLSILPKEAIA